MSNRLKCPPLSHHGQTQVCKVAASYGERSELGKDGEHVLWSSGTPQTTCFKNIPPIISEHWHILSFILLARRTQGYLVPFDWQGPHCSEGFVLLPSHRWGTGLGATARATSGLCPKAHSLTFLHVLLTQQFFSVFTCIYPLKMEGSRGENCALNKQIFAFVLDLLINNYHVL